MSNYRSIRERLKRIDDENAPKRRSFHKHLASDWDRDTGGWFYNYNHIRRWLEKHIGQNWDTVYSQMTQKFRKQGKSDEAWVNIVEWLVQTKTFLTEDGRPAYYAKYSNPNIEYLDEDSVLRTLLYICPETKTLKRTKRVSHKIKRETYFYVKIDKNHQAHQVDGIWYIIEMGIMPPYQWSERYSRWYRRELTVRDILFDTTHNLTEYNCDYWLKSGTTKDKMRTKFYGSPDLYAKNKRQMNSRELKKHNLQNLPANEIEKLKRQKIKELEIIRKANRCA